jgi:hypothetical protein
VVFDFKCLIYNKKKNIGHEHLFFSNHLKSTKNKTIIFWKAPTIKHTKIKHPHFDRKPPKYPDAKNPNLRYSTKENRQKEA